MNIQGIGQSYSAYTSSYSSSGMRGMQGSGFDPSTLDAAAIIEKEDTNLDGVLSVDETRLTDDMFSNADTDSDGMLTKSELEEMLANGPPPGGMGGMGRGGGMGKEPMSIESIFEIEDTDGDELISAEESALPDEVFSEIDTNQDAYLTAEEIQKSRENKTESSQQTQTLSSGNSGSSGSTLTPDMVIKAYQQAIQSFLLNLSGESSDTGSLASVLNAIA